MVRAVETMWIECIESFNVRHPLLPNIADILLSPSEKYQWENYAVDLRLACCNRLWDLQIHSNCLCGNGLHARDPIPNTFNLTGSL